MIFTEQQSNSIYDKLYDWLASYTPGGRCNISKLRKYHKEVWGPIIETIERLSNKPDLSYEEQVFLRTVTYNGSIFRIQQYNPKNKGYICENEFYQSWSRNIDGIDKVSNLSGTVLLIVGDAVNGIDVFGLLCFLVEYQKIVPEYWFREPKYLCQYEKEKEITYPIHFVSIKEIVTVEKENIHDWRNHKKSIPKGK
jgi:hypothetical protein